MSVLTRRHLTSDDLPEIRRLEAEVYEPGLRISDEAFLRLLILCPPGAWGVFDGTALCAMAFALPLTSGTVLDLREPLEALPPAADVLYIHNLAVAATYRGQGLAGQLVTTLFDLARGLGLRASELVSVQGSAPFWARFGFAAVAEFEYAPGAPATHMRMVFREVGPLKAAPRLRRWRASR